MFFKKCKEQIKRQGQMTELKNIDWKKWFVDLWRIFRFSENSEWVKKWSKVCKQIHIDFNQCYSKEQEANKRKGSTFKRIKGKWVVWVPSGLTSKLNQTRGILTLVTKLKQIHVLFDFTYKSTNFVEKAVENWFFKNPEETSKMKQRRKNKKKQINGLEKA